MWKTRSKLMIRNNVGLWSSKGKISGVSLGRTFWALIGPIQQFIAILCAILICVRYSEAYLGEKIFGPVENLRYTTLPARDVTNSVNKRCHKLPFHTLGLRHFLTKKVHNFSKIVLIFFFHFFIFQFFLFDFCILDFFVFNLIVIFETTFCPFSFHN